LEYSNFDDFLATVAVLRAVALSAAILVPRHLMLQPLPWEPYSCNTIASGNGSDIAPIHDTQQL